MKPLTARQADILDYMLDYAIEHGYTPTIREIIAYMGATSPNAAVNTLNALERKGYIKRTRGSARTIVFCDGNGKKPAKPDRLTRLCRELDAELDGVALPATACAIVNAIRLIVWEE